jgi:hypothetical protein
MLGGKLLLFVIPCSPIPPWGILEDMRPRVDRQSPCKKPWFSACTNAGRGSRMESRELQRASRCFEGSRPALSTIVPPKEQGRGTSDFGGRTSAALLAGTEYWARNKFDILARGPLAPLLLPLAGSPCLKSSARLSAPHPSFPNIPSPAPIAQSCLAAVGPAAPGAHLQRLQPARLVAFWTLRELLRANWRIC